MLIYTEAVMLSCCHLLEKVLIPVFQKRPTCIVFKKRSLKLSQNLSMVRIFFLHKTFAKTIRSGVSKHFSK